MKSSLKYSPLPLAAALATSLAVPATAAEEGTAAPEEKPRWESSAGLGVSLTRGNSKNLLVTINAQTARKWERNELNFGVDGGYGETELNVDGTRVNQTNTEFLRGYGQYNRLFTDRFYGYGRVDALYDSIADIDYRVSLSPGVGYYFIKNERTFLSGEFGPGYVFEKVGGIADDYATLRFGERFEHRFGEGARIWQSAEYVPQIEDFGNFVATFELGAEADLMRNLALRATLQHSYRSHPAADRLKNDTKLIAGINYKF